MQSCLSKYIYCLQKQGEQKIRDRRIKIVNGQTLKS